MAEDEEPGDYIEQRQDLHDCFFLVGRNKEKISTVRYFLANYSSYFRAMLLETDMREKNSRENIVIPDHEPDVFRLMLSFVYGRHDIKFKDVNQAMRFHILVDKCLMPKLKKISTKYLMENCKTNLCEILECAVLLDIKEMEPRAKMIVEKDTKALLSSPDFLDANPAIVEFIVKQEGLNATQIQLWHALVKWAERQCGNKKEANVLRKKIDNFIKHIQFLKMSLKEFAETVVPTAILTPTETVDIFVNMATGKSKGITEAVSKARHVELPTTCVLLLWSDGSKINNNQDWIYEYKIKNTSSTLVKISSMELTDTGIPHTIMQAPQYTLQCNPSRNPMGISIGSTLTNDHHPQQLNQYPMSYYSFGTTLRHPIYQAIDVPAERSGESNGYYICVKLLNNNNQAVSSSTSTPYAPYLLPPTYFPPNMIPKPPGVLKFSSDFIMEASKSYSLMITNSSKLMSNAEANRSYCATGMGMVNQNPTAQLRSCELCTVELVSYQFPRSASIIKSLTFTVVD